MFLRRFPWKAPRLTDNSYRLFASAPDEGSSRRSSEGRPKSEFSSSSGPEDPGQTTRPEHHRTSDTEASTRSHHHHHHHYHHDKHGETDASTPSTATSGSRVDASTKEVMKGPWRLLRLLPREPRGIIGLMLEIDPQRRATLEDMMQDPWVTQTLVCSQVEGGRVMKAAGHQHTLERSTTVSTGES